MSDIIVRPSQDLSTFTGNTVDFDVAITRLDINDVSHSVDLTSASVWCTLKTDNRYSDASALVQLSVGNGITITSASGGLVHVTIAAALTADFTNSRNVFYDVKIKEINLVETTVTFGKIFFQLATTRAT